MGARRGILVSLIGLLHIGGLMAQHGKYLNDSRNPAIGNPKAIAAGAAETAQRIQGLERAHATDAEAHAAILATERMQHVDVLAERTAIVPRCSKRAAAKNSITHKINLAVR